MWTGNRSKHHFIISNLLSLSQLNKKNAPPWRGVFLLLKEKGGVMGEEYET